MNRPIDRSEIITDLKHKHDIVVDSLSNDIGTQRAYVCLPVSLLERTAFDIISKKYLHKKQTIVFKMIVRNLMRRYPEAVSEAKTMISKQQKG